MKNKIKPPFVVLLNTDDGEVKFLNKEGFPPTLSLVRMVPEEWAFNQIKQIREEHPESYWEARAKAWSALVINLGEKVEDALKTYKEDLKNLNKESI